MRIIGGELGGRRFYPPADKWPTRPTTDFAKEALFNILQNRMDIPNISFLDLFGGTGSHCFEMISRGCQDVTYVDQFHGCLKFVKALSQKLEVEENIRIVASDVFKFISRTQETYNYVFAGPPYALPNLYEIPDVIFEKDLLAEGGLFILEHNHGQDFSGHPRFVELRKYGQCHFSFFG